MLLIDAIAAAVAALLCAFASIFYTLRGGATRCFKLKAIIQDNQRSIFITGCDSGFGFLAARRFGQDGFRVFAGCLTEEGAKGLVEEESELPKNHVNVSVDEKSLIPAAYKKNIVPIMLDITKQESVDGALRKVREELGDHGGLWALINNAGVSGATFGYSLSTVEDFDFTMRVNFLGQIRMTKAFLPLLQESSGRLVQMSSMLGNVAIGGCAPYAASKFAMLGATDALRKEIAMSSDMDVAVCLVCPGFHETALFEEEIEKAMRARVDELDETALREKYDEEYIQKAASAIRQMTERFSKNTHPEDVVDAYVDACTARHPKKNYWVGRDATWLFRLVRPMNEDAQDLIYVLGAKHGKHPGF